MACINATARPATVPTCHRQLRELTFVDSSSSLVEFGLFPGPSAQWKLNCTRNALVLPGIRAESSTQRILSRCQILQSRSDSQALLKMVIRGITVSDVRGFGSQGGSTDKQAGSEFSEDEFLAKAKMEIVVSKEQVEAVIDKIIEEARTGEIGDGKIFLVPISDVIRVRTVEHGDKGERMSGGRANMFSTS